jgi:DNA-binding SARP family transcriptional activator/tetratricopeptide (TPR) repeat protein
MAGLTISVLGTLSLLLNGQPLIGFKSDKGRALLVYLAVEADRAHRRERLAGLLWPDWPNREALARLSDTLSNLRRILGDQAVPVPFLSVTPSALQFNAGSDYYLDVHEFERLTRGLPHEILDARPPVMAELERAVATYQGPFLEGFSLKDSPPFEEWALLKRERLAQHISRTLRKLVALCEAGRDYEAAQRHASRLLQLEPLDEENYRIAMRTLASAGKRSAALAVYETCCRVLAQEFNIEPDRETVTLSEQIRAGRFADVKPPATALPAAGPGQSTQAGPPVPVDTRSRIPAAPPLPGGSLENHPGGLPVNPPPSASPSPRGAAGAYSTHFVAREPELARLGGYLELARAGQGRVAFVTGEAGSGKTALLAEFARRAMAEDPELLVASGSCNALVGVGDPYLPFRDILQMLAGDFEARSAGRSIAPDHARRLWALLPACVQALVEHGPDLLDLFVPSASLLQRIEALSQRQGDAGATQAAAQLADGLRRQRPAPAGHAGFFEQYAQVLRALAARRPLLLLLGDLQWADGGSLSLLFHLSRRLAPSKILILGTYRPDDVNLGRDGGRHPIEGIVNELQRDFGDLLVPLPAAPGRAFVDALLDAEPNALPDSFRDALTCRTGGHPLFTVEMLRGLQERADLVRDGQGRWIEGPALDWDRLPSRIEAVLAERVERLPAQARALLETASVEGEEFTAEVVACVLGTGEDEVSRLLSGTLRHQQLVRSSSLRRLGLQRLSRHRFTHYVLRQYLYSRLDPVGRARLHESVGTTLEALYGGQAPEISVQLAWHFEQAGLAGKAVDYLLAAGQQAMRLSAYREAIRHFERGLALLATLPPSADRTGRELDLRMPLANALIATRGWAAPERFAALGDVALGAGNSSTTRQAILMLIQQSAVLQAKGEFAKAIQVDQEALARARLAGDRQSLMLSYGSLGITCLLVGSWPAARDHLQNAADLYLGTEDHELLAVIGADPQAILLSLLAVALWTAGCGDQAREVAWRARRAAEELGQPITQASVVDELLTFDILAGLPADFEQDISLMLRLGEERNWPVIRTAGEIYQGWWLACHGEVAAGVAQMKAVLASWQPVGNVGRLPRCQTIYAQMCLDHGLIDEALAAADEMLALCRQGIGRLVEPELHRLRGACLQERAGEDAALQVEVEACYVRAVEIAREQGAHAWELRAALSLARLWQQQGRPCEARDLLATAYGSFSEGFDLPDLRAAAALLADLIAQVDAQG